MSIDKRFVVKKDDKTDVITYMEYDKIDGFRVKPKKTINFEDMINVNEMIVINPSLIQKLISKKCTRNFDKILKMMSVVSEDEDDGDTGYVLVHDQLEKFRMLLINKYKAYMDEAEYETTLKKVELLEQEVEARRNRLIEQLDLEVSKKKSSR